MSMGEEARIESIIAEIGTMESDRIGQIDIIENGFVVEKDYCLNCRSLDIRVSKRDNKYCGKICWN